MQERPHAQRRVAAALVVGVASAFLAMTPKVAAASNQTVTNCNDSGPGSLRQAVRDATSGGDVTFELSQSCTTIVLSSTIHITHNVSIDGPGPGGVEVSGNNAVDVFDVASG